MEIICRRPGIDPISLDIFFDFFPLSNRQIGGSGCTHVQKHTHTHRLVRPREIKSQLRGRKTNLEGQTKHLSSCVCLVGK